MPSLGDLRYHRVERSTPCGCLPVSQEDLLGQFGDARDHLGHPPNFGLPFPFTPKRYTLSCVTLYSLSHATTLCAGSNRVEVIPLGRYTVGVV